ncbi:uncharacterized protein LOC121397697 [Xenopus laevis]|uniref:Uncharacterized protein LOC121397697 n=1 Tax=Xenopus laevis TaxID=8355 RepID=A0A8J1LMN0_XENLA|nr:uncharacterized protein LOC121397697 [Xenopus laevis]
MDFLDNLANKSKFKFDIPHSVMYDAEIWSDLYTQCMNANMLVEKKDISFSRLKHKIQNVMLLVKTFNTLMCSERKENDVEKITTPDKREVECDRVSNDCLAKEISKHELRLSEIESVLQRNNQVSVITKEQRSMLVPDLNNPELDYDRAKLQLKINKQLFKIVKEIPHFNPKLNVLMISDLFESHIEKYDLSEEQKNKVFKLWVPIQICHRLSIPVTEPEIDIDGNLIYGTRRERLLQLNYIINGEEFFNTALLNDLKTSIDDDPFVFMGIFEQAYRLVMGIKEDQVPEEMVRVFVKKFQYLDTGADVRASMFNTLTEAATYIDKYRRHLVLQSSDPSNKHMIREICQTKKADMKPHKKAYCFFCGKLGHLFRKCFLRRKSMKRFKVDKDSGIIQEKVQVKQLDAQNGHSQCSIDRPVCPYKRPRAEDKRSYSLLMKTRNNY